MKSLVADIYFDQLKQRNPEDVCEQFQCEYNYDKKCYILSVWNDQYTIFPNLKTIERISQRLPQHHPLLDVFIMYYLTRKRGNKTVNIWISEKDMIGGTTFFRGPHAIPTKIIKKKYLDTLENFENKCEQLSGIPIKLADSAYFFRITRDVRVAILYWLGDETFKPEARILFDKSLKNYLPLDVVFSLATDVLTRFSGLEKENIMTTSAKFE